MTTRSPLLVSSTWAITAALLAAFLSDGAPSRAATPDITLTPLRAGMYQNGWIDFNKNGKRDLFEDPSQPIEKRIEDLLSQMTLEEKTCQLATLYGYKRVLEDPLPTPQWKSKIWKDGIANIDEMHNGIGLSGDKNPYAWPPSKHARTINEIQRWFIEETRLGIPVDFTNEGIRGACAYRATNFPAQIGLGATWDRELITSVGQVTGREAKSLGFTNIYSPIMELSRDPRWGRVAECYSEDPYLASELAIRQALAIQKNGIAATAKCLAVHSEPKGGRDNDGGTDPHVTFREMEMLHLWPWERLVEQAGILGVMSSYNDYDGVPLTGSHEFLIDRLRSQWGFRGYVVSDSDAVEMLYRKHHVADSIEDACGMYLREGGNVRTNFDNPSNFILPIRALVKAGKLPMSVIDDRVRDVLRVKFLIGLFDHPYVEAPDQADAIVHSAEGQAAALRAARESLVLLKNQGGTLPLSKSLRHILITGPAAVDVGTSFDRYGSTGGHVTTLVEGVKRLLGPAADVAYSQGARFTDARWPESEIFPEPPADEDARLLSDAVAQAAHADAIIVALGDSNDTIGEGKSRTSLDLPGFQTDLAKAMVATGKPVIVVLYCGRPASVNWIARYAPALLEAWFPGEAGGQAIAETIFGDFNPGGKLPVTFPRSVGQVPFNFPHKPGSQASQTKDANPNGWGNSMIEGALYPFGFGLSYTQFAYSGLTVTPDTSNSSGSVTVTCVVQNTGAREGDEIPQLYVRLTHPSVTTYDLMLRGFERVHLKAGESRKISFALPMNSLWIINRAGNRIVEPQPVKVFVGASSEDLRLEAGFTITPADTK